jgi:heme-binding protein
MLLWMKRLILPLVILLLGIQIFRPARRNPPVDPKREIHVNVSVDPAVAAVFARSCNDCHSNRTAWPWYSQVAPASWLVVSDVNRGRKALNFSEWSGYGAKEQQKHLSEVCKEVSEGEMPGLAYRLLHSNAKLNEADVAAVCLWTKGARPNLSAEEEEE